MSQLRATKPGLLVCTAVCVCIFLYLRDPPPEEPEESTYPAAVECGFYPDELCSALSEGKEAAPQIATFCKNPHGSQILAHLRTPGNCSRISQEVHFITRPLSAEEGNFSLAYIVTTHKDLAMFVQLLRSIYVPQNLYCIHVDKKAPKKYKSAVQTLVSCFENIFISSKRGRVAHTGFTRLQADLTCMRDLVRSKFQWNYVLNLCGHDFPIKTNKEIIRYIRSKWTDKNITPGVIQPPNVTSETSGSRLEFTPEGSIYGSPNRRFKDEPPHNLTIYFGSAYYVLTRKFVEFVLTDIRAKDLLQWSRDVQSPEQHYWVTLNRLKGKNIQRYSVCSDQRQQQMLIRKWKLYFTIYHGLAKSSTFCKTSSTLGSTGGSLGVSGLLREGHAPNRPGCFCSLSRKKYDQYLSTNLQKLHFFIHLLNTAGYLRGPDIVLGALLRMENIRGAWVAQ
ncbi:beta-1,3-galactosyl-O-glycosyl-glycoprotein beta-1,6-N-acetylglucosaminyltransferase 7-like isoform X1 [Neofelis nebulosa]|uniref:beta-1,3-galactosyl-O-glycosyl-glycoprotein beta-1,6-N-acetylglucosaminyltransferase 7-like isoform X1 n=1 Tax=Neofelis nebulosa TaxID=61452 RepID=UPI00272A9628|nr:beta-1,3-galactosyl-O-glycosyl-glycoprotein beta-1,6-N-acetylglucosaminyltransferase 7-like isoform X1 [Neofelis nebulosa]XP_058542013.1 beta-1,3-galactosyl-O-glycosyl-glycoprotein beta-1,6-N-acetylglucosaminyltransferase 7-like isoform X1 [Neofelis nebulosa]XP_058542014.1 beta-1,3-galactosyl-O-glycosyl-glycoprotein beta-1,6-N-acetylglucosaminyltransferase 7-like isoform X1 [Neofelis nebulosa]XP_058542015.1 beta-1,3-galactosyl-O-glycosyl-glycoprotein beta-1,6-N-acetylglucosaminyltransferase 7